MSSPSDFDPAAYVAAVAANTGTRPVEFIPPPHVARRLNEYAAENERLRSALARVKVELRGTTAEGGDAEAIIDAALRESETESDA